VNIQENIGYPELEFVLLDYNSKDGLQDWVRDNMSGYIETGILKYYRTDEPEYYSGSHSRNIAFRVASGDILCLVDADNFAGPGYAGWVADSFSTQGINTLITTIRKDAIPLRDQGGKMGFSSKLFHAVNGIDESFRSYGMEDVDLVNRLEKAGGTRKYVDRDEFLRFIGHSNNERLTNYPVARKIESLYIPVDVSETPTSDVPVLYLFKDGTFHEFHYTFDIERGDEHLETNEGWSLTEDRCRKGRHQHTDAGLTLDFGKGAVAFYARQAEGRLVSRDPDRQVALREIGQEHQWYGPAMMAYGECYNRMIYLQNDKGDRLINPGGWGKGVVYLNFDESRPISLA
jgi:glycosyltransferase involved in cell wall biosynthesis